MRNINQYKQKNKIKKQIGFGYKICTLQVVGSLLRIAKIFEKKINDLMRKSVKYSEVRKILKLDTRRPKVDEGLAAVTHYLQSKNNGAKVHYIENATNYIEENNLVSEPAFQYELPIEYDIPFPPPKIAA